MHCVINNFGTVNNNRIRWGSITVIKKKFPGLTCHITPKGYCLFRNWALFPVTAWKPVLIDATEHREPQVSHCKKCNLPSFWSNVSADLHVWQVTYSSGNGVGYKDFRRGTITTLRPRIQKWQLIFRLVVLGLLLTDISFKDALNWLLLETASNEELIITIYRSTCTQLRHKEVLHVFDRPVQPGNIGKLNYVAIFDHIFCSFFLFYLPSK